MKLRKFHTETAATPAAPAQPGAGFAEIVTATLLASLALVIVSGGVSLLIWRSVWIELSLALALVPFALLAVGCLGYLRHNLLWTLEDLLQRDIDQDGEIGEPEARFVYVHQSGPQVNGISEADLRYFVTTICSTGDWSVRSWKGAALPSGRRCDQALHAQMTAVLEKAGLLVDRTRGSSGRLVTTDARAIMSKLGIDA